MVIVDKKGVSHIETILAFVLFIGFLIFAFVFLSPFQGNRTLDSSLEYAEIEVSKFAEVEIETYSLLISELVTPITIGISISGAIPFNAFVKDSSENQIASFTENGIVNFVKPVDNFVKIIYSESFEEGETIAGTLVDPIDYTISSFETGKIFSEDKFNQLKVEYDSNYFNLKTQFNLPNRVDFGFSIVFNDGSEIIGEREIPENFEVISTLDRVEIIRTTGEIEFVDLIVRVW